MIIKIINQKVTSISKSSLIADFLNKYKNDPKIVIVNNISDKFLFGIKHNSNYPNTELFLGKEMMMNIIDDIAVPKHILLSDDEMKLVLNSYHAKRREMPEILRLILLPDIIMQKLVKCSELLEQAKQQVMHPIIVL